MHLPSAENSPVDSSSVSTSSSFEKPEDNAITSVQTPTQMDGTTQLSQIKVLTRTNCGQNTLKTLSIDKNTTTTKEFTRQLYECYGITLRCKRRVLDWVLMRETLVACVLVTRTDLEDYRDDGFVYIKYRTVDEGLSRVLQGDTNHPGSLPTYLRPYTTASCQADSPAGTPEGNNNNNNNNTQDADPNVSSSPYVQLALMLDIKLSPSRMAIWLAVAMVVSVAVGVLAGRFTDVGGRDLGLAVGGLTMAFLSTVWGVISSIVGSRRVE